MLTTINGPEENFQMDLNMDLDSVPVLALRNMVPFPWSSHPIHISREESLAVVRYAEKNKTGILLLTQKDPNVEHPNLSDLHRTGVMAKVLKVLILPDDTTTAIICCLNKATVLKMVKKKPFLRVKAELVEENLPEDNDLEVPALVSSCRETFMAILDSFDTDETREIKFGLDQEEAMVSMLNFIILNSPLSIAQKLELRDENDIKKRATKLSTLLGEALQLIKLKADITSKTQMQLSQKQREHFLQEQLKSIQDELGGSDEQHDIDMLHNRAKEKEWSKDAQMHFDKELMRLQRYNINSPDYAVQYTYLETLLNLPWDKIKTSEVKIPKVREILDRDHFGMEEVKERIEETMAVMKLRKDMHSPILCLYGPPGVGKTSLGKSVAEALGREYARVSFGGLHDEAEIRGHRRTYIGAMPGRVISALAKCEYNNPVFVLDEIDKIGQDFKGDPSTALLELLDPEQNNKFHDNYLNVDYDLSKVLFIATANNLSTVSRPLLDRMELIEITGYIPAEKVEIASRHLVKKALQEHGMEKDEVHFLPEALEYMVNRYTRESGVRQLSKIIAKVIRKVALLKASEKEYPRKIGIEEVKGYLGVETVNPDIYENNDTLGVVAGLAWTEVGGEILFVEASLAPGKGEQLTLTGNLGNVMKESATLARQYLKANAAMLGIDSEKFGKYDIHIHVPEGAIPKDGPSAGITMVTALASAFTERKVKERLAMTGEITLRGKVLPVGGIKEKILAAKRAGITEIILSSQNRPDIGKIPSQYVEGVKFHYVDRISEVLEIALV